MKIAVSGDLGSGKSLLCKSLAERFSCDVLSGGALQREMAKEYNMSTLEFNKYSEAHPEIDLERDKKLVEMANSFESVVIDSRLAWHFVANSFKIHLIVNRFVAAERVLASQRVMEGYASVGEAVEKLQERKSSENKRFLEIYGVNCDDFENYDLVIDATTATPAEVLDLAIKAINSNGKLPSKVWIAPQNMYPLQSIRDSLVDTSMPKQEFAGSVVRVIPFDGWFFIYEDTKLVVLYCKERFSFVPVHLITDPKEIFYPELGIGEYVKTSYRQSDVYDWEDANSFVYKTYPRF